MQLTLQKDKLKTSGRRTGGSLTRQNYLCGPNMCFDSMYGMELQNLC